MLKRKIIAATFAALLGGFICSIPVVEVAAQYAPHYPRELLPYENSVCRIRCQDRDGSFSCGSGVLIQAPATHRKRDYVLTCYHVVRNRRSDLIEITWNGTTWFRSSVAAARPGSDTCILKLDLGRPIPSALLRVPIATSDISLGETAYAFGFGSTMENRLRCSGGRFTDIMMNSSRQPVFFEFAGFNRQGDSGGPVFVVRNRKVFVVGQAWGTGWRSEGRHHIIIACRLGVIRQLFGIRQQSQPQIQYQYAPPST